MANINPQHITYETLEAYNKQIKEYIKKSIQNLNLSRVAVSGSYYDLLGTPDKMAPISHRHNIEDIDGLRASNDYNDLSNKPTKLSDFSNDRDYASTTEVREIINDVVSNNNAIFETNTVNYIEQHNTDTEAHNDIRNRIEELNDTYNEVQNQIDTAVSTVENAVTITNSNVIQSSNNADKAEQARQEADSLLTDIRNVSDMVDSTFTQINNTLVDTKNEVTKADNAVKSANTLLNTINSRVESVNNLVGQAESYKTQAQSSASTASDAVTHIDQVKASIETTASQVASNATTASTMASKAQKALTDMDTKVSESTTALNALVDNAKDVLSDNIEELVNENKQYTANSLTNANTAKQQADRAKGYADTCETYKNQVASAVQVETDRAIAAETANNDALSQFKGDFELLRSGFVSVKEFGAVGDGVTDDTEAIQAAINSAAASGKSLVFPAGEYIVTHTLVLPKNERHFGAISLVGVCSEYTFGIRRKAITSSTYEYAVYGTVIRCEMENSVLFEVNRTFLNLENICFQDCTANHRRRNSNAFALNGLLDESSEDNRSRFYIRECSFVGFKSVVGSEDTLERVAYHISRCRFEGCITGLVNGIDSSVADSAFSGGKHAVVFSNLPGGNSGAGASTVVQCRIEWTSDAGIKIDSGNTHNVLISANEFDRCGGPGLAVLNGKNISITSNVFRRNGAVANEAYGSESYHMFIGKGENIVITGNSTRCMNSQDSGDGVNIPNLSYYISNDCKNVIMSGNDWSGCVNTQIDIESTKRVSIPAMSTVSLPFKKYLGLISVCTLDKYTRGGVAYISTAGNICTKYAGGDSFFAVSQGTFTDPQSLTSNSVYVGIKSSTLYLCNTSSSKVEVTIKTI